MSPGTPHSFPLTFDSIDVVKIMAEAELPLAKQKFEEAHEQSPA